MKLLIEEYPYNPTPEVLDALDGLFTLQNLEGKIPVRYVGYYYNPKINDMVFVLPKVIINEKGKAFNEYDPNEIVDVETAKITDKQRKFLYVFAVWVHRAIVVFKEANPDSKIVHSENIESAGHGLKKKSNTWLDVIIALIRFNKEHRSFITFIVKNLHSGFNKINWNKTISKSTAIIDSECPVYLNAVNKKKEINFDEELIVIFFSILEYVKTKFGFKTETPYGFKLIKGAQFEKYIKGFGRRRLRQIKYKYFSDVALQMWNLCYAFFDKAYQISMSVAPKEYLLVNSFHVVFEAMIDELIGEKDIPTGLKNQDDGKLVDHFYTYDGLLIDRQKENDIYYIGDSKYYQLGHDISKESVCKQYTYARNVIQWNMNFHLSDSNDKEKTKYHDIKLFDKETEGYNVIPNFFVSADIDNDTLGYEEKLKEHKEPSISKQFDNRLYDRDTLIISHFDVNFLHVLSLYARNNVGAKELWKSKVRKTFRESIQKVLKTKFTFYAMQAHPDVDAHAYFKANFQQTLGKTYQPYEDKHVFSLALDKEEKYKEQNAALIATLAKNFYVKEIELGEDPSGPLDSERIIKGAVESPDGMGKFLFGIVTKYKDDKDGRKDTTREYRSFTNREATDYVMRKMPTGDITQVRYFVPMFDGGIEGYYEIKKITFGLRLSDEKDHDGNPVRLPMPCLNVKLGKYTSFGDGTSAIPMYRHWNGQIHSYAEVIAQYQQGL